MNFAYLKGHQSEWSEKVNWTETSFNCRQANGRKMAQEDHFNKYR